MNVVVYVTERYKRKYVVESYREWGQVWSVLKYVESCIIEH